MSNIFIEYRPRLGAAHIYLSIDGQSSFGDKSSIVNRYFATVVENENAILVAACYQNGDPKEISKFMWPEKCGKILLSEPGRNIICSVKPYFSAGAG